MMGQSTEKIFEAHEAQCDCQQHQARAGIEETCELIHDCVLKAKASGWRQHCLHQPRHLVSA
jgi:hypothetical protein